MIYLTTQDSNTNPALSIKYMIHITYPLLVIPLLSAIASPVERVGRLMCASHLNLHEKGSIVRTLRSTSLCSVHIIPCISTAENIIHLFLLGFHRGCVNTVNVMQVRACGATKSHSSGTILQQKQISTDWTKVHVKRDIKML